MRAAITHYESFGMKHVLDTRTRRKHRIAEPKPFYLVTRSHFQRLVENVVAGAQPPVQMSCDWLTRDPLRLGIQVFPIRTYEILRELRNGNSVS